MSAVAEQLRAELRERLRRLPPEDRLELALALGRRDAAFYASARCVPLEVAVEALRSARRRGRRASGCAAPDIG